MGWLAWLSRPRRLAGPTARADRRRFSWRRALAADVALIVAEFSANAWTHGSLPITVALRLQDGILTVEVSDAGPGLALFAGPRPLGAGGRGFPGAAAIAHEMGVDGRAAKTRVWACLHFQWLSTEPEPAVG